MRMVGESRLNLQLLAGVLILCPDVSLGKYPKAIPTEAGESICSLSRNLKDVALWTARKVDALRRSRDEYGSKILDWQLHFQGSSGCGGNESLLDDIRMALEKVNAEIGALQAKAIRAGALAAKSAGRLDEFIMVFANAQGGTDLMGKVNYCLGVSGRPARRRDLLDCFPEGKKLEIGEANLAKIPESATHNNEPYLTAIMEDVKHGSLASYFNRKYGGDGESDCNMINGSGGILSSALHDNLWWGGGILTIGKDFTGSLSSRENFIAGEIKDAKEANKALWTGLPTTVPHLNKTLTAFQAFKDAAARITQKFAEIEKIEKQIDPCLSNEIVDEGIFQPCFKSAVKLNAELQAANALLARYHKEKGPLPPEGALILHQSVVNILYLPFAFLL